MSETFNCLLCEHDKSRPWLSACPDYYLELGPPVNYVECLNCSLVQQTPIPDNIAPFYQDYPVHTKRTRAQQLARQYLHRQVYYRPESEVSSQTLLDYGCGDGVYLREIAGHYQAVLGYEPSESHSTKLADSLGIPVYSQTDNLERDWAGMVDVVTSHFVMEHVSDLHHAFRVFQHVLKPGGLLYIAVPNIRSWEARLFGRKWHGLDAPRHISFPDISTFERLSGLYGFDGLTSKYAIFPNTVAASLCTVLTGGFNPALFNMLILPSWLAAAVSPSGSEVFQFRKLDDGKLQQADVVKPGRAG